jgi:3'-phosphoadenosine 5'-phosphosulfate sulfotransferase (PAPS reductase)/FAD synthetase
MTPDLDSYDTIIVAFSGGKDSQASFLHLLDEGVPHDNIELWHHCIDGDGDRFMDWPVTEDYCRKFAEFWNVPIYYSWKTGGFKREMLRENQKTASIKFETPNDGTIETGGTRGNNSTRRKFPQVSANLNVRWCSAYLKIDVGACAVRNQPRFEGKRTLFITGERAQESKARANYNTLEPHRSDLRNGKRKQRHVDHWRPIHQWTESQVWEIIERYSVNPHPAYHLGWGRVSCATCIFASEDQWASVREIMPDTFDEIADYEDEFGFTIRQNKNVRELADRGQSFDGIQNAEMVRQAVSETYDQPIMLTNWTLPEGAFGDSAGPS